MGVRRRVTKTRRQTSTTAVDKKRLADLDQKTKLVTTKLQQLQTQYTSLFEEYVTGHVLPFIGTVIDQGVEPSLVFTDELRDKLVNAVKYGVDMWRLQAHFSNIQIMGQSAIGNPGCLQGPDIKSWILQSPGVYNMQGDERLFAHAVAEGVATNFKQWQDMVTVPGLPWYPMFVAVAAPFAPPTPNIPMPLMVCVSQNFSKLASPSQLELSINSGLPESLRTAEANTFIYMLSVHLVNYFISWLTAQNVMMVMGMGPVPTFNPPYVPVGPVVNGAVIPSPGHLAI